MSQRIEMQRMRDSERGPIKSRLHICRLIYNRLKICLCACVRACVRVTLTAVLNSSLLGAMQKVAKGRRGTHRARVPAIVTR